jgi:hypothetical protein
MRPKWGPQREIRQTVCERLNDVLGEALAQRPNGIY